MLRPLSRACSRAAATAALILSSFTPLALHAQTGSPMIGTWAIDWESGRRIENDEVTVIRSQGTLAIVASGDSLLATLTATSRSDNAPLPKPSTFGGRTTVAGASFKQANEMRMNMNGQEHVQTVIATWTLSADGEQLTGTIARDMPGMQMPMAMEPAMVTGKRQR